MFKIKSIQNNIKSFFLILLSILLLNSSIFAQIPSGYYNNANGLSGLQLKTALKTIITNNYISVSYDYLWTAYQTTDKKLNGKVWDMYSDIPNGTPAYQFTFTTDQCGTYSIEGECYNREHSFPQSWFNEASPMVSDLFHVYPTDGKVNGMRNNYPFGKVGTATYTSSNGSKLGNSISPGYTGTVFEPIDSYKGDFARSYFYMATRYENQITGWQNNGSANTVLDGTTFPCFDQWFLNVLLSWCALDPVSQKEIDRNNAVYAIQHNRNPYIDHPEYINYIWGGATPLSTEPSNYPADFSAKNIHLQWVDATGSVLPNRYLIRMSTTGFNSISTPADGVVYPDNANDQNINYGVQTAFFKNLNSGTTYYFKLFSYTLNGGIPDYKTDGNIPEISKTLP